MDILLGILAIVVGTAVCLAGLRLFVLLLPVWGFVVGFLGGAALVTALAGDGFLSTTLGIVVGIVVGIAGAILAYLFWYVGVILAAGSAGSLLGATLFAAIGVKSTWALFIIGVIIAALFILAAFIIQLPIYLVIVNTALAGATVVVGGLLLIFNKIDRADIGTTAAWQQIHHHWLLWLLWAVIAAIGIGSQLTAVEQATLPDERWGRLPQSV
jgi:hypothetical protein